ncbi:MAG TPA: hypothetical protein VM432_09910 [Bdellovibrionales bacterium]|nr:hypothetical protein [Bdellovibrionales bacterium]
MSALKSRPTVSERNKEVAAEPTRAAWLKAVYSLGLVEASWPTAMLSDKRILSEVVQRELGSEANRFYPKTIGLREFLVSKKLVTRKGKIVADGDKIEAALFQEFPAGFVARPAVGVAAYETSRGLYPTTDAFIVELMKTESRLFKPIHLKKAIQSHILKQVASGEAIVLQEDIVAVADARKRLHHRFSHEVRIHTFENRVVQGAVPKRWVQTDMLHDKDVRDAEEFVQAFLSKMPISLLKKQAWGVDVALMDNGDMRIVDVVTNRGDKIGWSSYLDQPWVLAAYTRHFEEFAGVEFEGLSGFLIRHGFANYFPYWQRRIDKAQTAWTKFLAYLPPFP